MTARVRSRALRRMSRRSIVTVMAATLLLIVGGGTATALYAAGAPRSAVPAIPTGTDCLRPPTAATPNEGIMGLIDSGPASPRDGDPFAAGSDVSLYEVYGYGGYGIYLFDPGCLDINRVWDPDNAKANAFLTGSLVVVALTVKLTAVVTDSSFGKLFDPLQEKARQVLGDGLFWPLIGLVLAATALLILASARKGDVAGQARTAFSSLTLLIVAAATLVYSGLFVGTIDAALTGSFKASGQIATSSTTTRTDVDASTMIGANLIDSVIYPGWAMVTFGNNEAAATKYGPELFKAGTLTRKESAEVAANPKRAEEIYKGKKNIYKEVAKKIETEYPAAYTYVAGNRSDIQMWAALLPALSTLAATGFLLYSLIRIIWAMVVVRIGFGMASVVALVAQVPRWNHLALELATWVFQALAQAVAFAFVFNIFLAGGVGGIMDPTNGWNPILRALALVIASYAMWAVLKRLGLTGGPWQTIGRRIPKRGRGRGGKSHPPRKPDAGPPPSYAGFGRRPAAPPGGSGYTAPVRPRPLPSGGRGGAVAAIRPAPAAALAPVPGGVIAGTVVRGSVTLAAHAASSRAVPGGRVLPARGQASHPYAATVTSARGSSSALERRSAIPMPREKPQPRLGQIPKPINPPQKGASS